MLTFPACFNHTVHGTASAKILGCVVASRIPRNRSHGQGAHETKRTKQTIRDEESVVWDSRCRYSRPPNMHLTCPCGTAISLLWIWHTLKAAASLPMAMPEEDLRSHGGSPKTLRRLLFLVGLHAFHLNLLQELRSHVAQHRLTATDGCYPHSTTTAPLNQTVEKHLLLCMTSTSEVSWPSRTAILGTVVGDVRDVDYVAFRACFVDIALADCEVTPLLRSTLLHGYYDYNTAQ